MSNGRFMGHRWIAGLAALALAVALPATTAAADSAPVVGAIDAGQPVEGQYVTAQAPFVPGSPTATYTCTVEYGDGAGAEAGTVSGATCQGPLHKYFSWGSFTVTVVVSDSNGATGSNSTSVSVTNVPPGMVYDTTTQAVLILGQTANLDASFEDPGTSESYTATLAWGDGTTTVVNLGPGSPVKEFFLTHVYATAGNFPTWLTISDGQATSDAVTNPTFYVTAAGVAPTVGPIDVGQPVESQYITAQAPFVPGSQNATYTCTVDYGDGSGAQMGTIIGTTCQGPLHRYGSWGSFTITVAVSDSNGATGTNSRTVSVANVAPGIVIATSTQSIVKVGSTVTVDGSFDDPGTTESYTATLTWGDGSSTVVTLGSAVREYVGTHVYATSGMYQIGFTVSDGLDTTSQAIGHVFYVYDPARTLSGSGSIASPKGACSLSKKCSAASTATFSVSAKYAKNATKPTVSLSYSATGFSLTATAADFFITGGVGGSWTEGTAKVNGVAGYTFQLIAIDGRPDTLRLMVWSPSGALAYDNGGSALRCGNISIR